MLTCLLYVMDPLTVFVYIVSHRFSVIDVHSHGLRIAVYRMTCAKLLDAHSGLHPSEQGDSVLAS